MDIIAFINAVESTNVWYLLLAMLISFIVTASLLLICIRFCRRRWALNCFTILALVSSAAFSTFAIWALASVFSVAAVLIGFAFIFIAAAAWPFVAPHVQRVDKVKIIG